MVFNITGVLFMTRLLSNDLNTGSIIMGKHGKGFSRLSLTYMTTTTDQRNNCHCMSCHIYIYILKAYQLINVSMSFVD